MTVETTNSKPTDWSKKYRPKCLEDMILPSSTKRALVAIRDREVGPSLLFHGPHGVGKTMAAVLLRSPKVSRIMNCTTDSKPNDVAFAHIQESDDWSNRIPRVILFDNADRLRRSVQEEARAWMEVKARRNLYVLTANDPKKLIAPIHSCVVPVDFSRIRRDPELLVAMYQRAMQIVHDEEIDADPSVVKAIVKQWFPDMRHILVRLQFEIGLIAEPS
jgi:DNA polymerase III delta prime subunit